MRIKRPSPAFFLAFLALLVALGGVASALPGKNSVDKNDIKKNAVSSSDIKKQAVKSSDLKNNGIKGKDLKDEAVKTDKLGDGSVTSSKTSFYGVSALENVSAAASQVAAPEVTLLTRGPFTIYGKCFVDGAQVDAEVYIKTSETALFASNDDEKEGQNIGSGAGYLEPGTPEEQREIQNDADANANDADGVDSNEGWFNATNGQIAIEGRVLNYAKQGTPVGGDGPYGPGNRCIFHAWLLNQAG